MDKEVLSAAAIALTFLSFWPYIRSIRRGESKPHVFSWLIWGVTTFIVFLAQLAAKGGAGAWPIGISALITFYIGYLAFRRKSDLTITTLDWVFLIMALASVPFWWLTNDPLWAVLILTTIDLLGFGPTFRKAYADPFSENLTMYVMIIFRNGLALAALEELNWTTATFPAAVAVGCLAFVGMVCLRRALIRR